MSVDFIRRLNETASNFRQTRIVSTTLTAKYIIDAVKDMFSRILRPYLIFVLGHRQDVLSEQGHRHNGDQAAGRPHMMCSICGRRFTTPLFAVRIGMSSFGSPPCIPNSSPLTHISISNRLTATSKGDFSTSRFWGIGFCGGGVGPIQ